MKKHILVISQYFYPEQFRINDICSEWVKRGYDVTVITGIPNYPQGKFHQGYGWFKRRRETYNGIRITRIPILPRGKSAIMLSLNYLSFVLSGYFWQLFTKVKADYVFIFEVSPMTQALPGIWYANKKKVPCYLYVQDLWPENVEIVAGIKNERILGAIGRMVDYIYARCTRIFTTSNSFVKAIENRGIASEKIEYWPQYAEDFYQPMPKTSMVEIPQDNAFNIIFAGNIGHAQGLDILPKVASLLRTRGLERKVRFNIVGDGRYKDELIELAGTMGVSNMFNFIPKQPASKIPEFMGICDAAFLCLTDSPLFAMTIPAKVQSYMACGVPIIASADGETYYIIKEASAGFCCPAGDVAGLEEIIFKMINCSSDELKQMGINGRKYYNKNFSKEELLDRMDVNFR